METGIKFGCTVRMNGFIPLAELFFITPQPHIAASLAISPSAALAGQEGWRVDPAELQRSGTLLWLVPTERVGSAPQQYNSAYIAAMLSLASVDKTALEDAVIPAVEFTTDEATRRSMTLNGMRMTMELQQTGSRRMLELIENRLAAGQRDIAHDVLVYLMRQIWDIRAEEREERDLRAESVAAFMGLDESATRTLFQSPSLSAVEIACSIENGAAGEPRRKLDLEPLLENQLALLQPPLAALREREELFWGLIGEVSELLRAHPFGV
jgi:hypothetical protein